MKFVVFGPHSRLGLIDGDTVLDLARAGEVSGISNPCLASLLSLIEAGEAGLDCVRKVAESARGADAPGLFTPLSAADLQAPWPGQRFALAGMNHPDHVVAWRKQAGRPVTPENFIKEQRAGLPQMYWAMARPVVGPGGNVEMPGHANGYLDYEGEAAIVLGKRGRDIKASKINDYIWGVALVTDWSVRDGVWPLPPQSSMLFKKNFDSSKSFGPCIVVGEVDVNDLEVETYVNGERRQKFFARNMSFSYGEVIEYMSQNFTLYPGDVLSGGTGAGTAMDSSPPDEKGWQSKDRFLKIGDTVEIRCSAIGSLSNTIVPKALGD
jgi:acylpyruvate hydrolase